MISVEAIKSKPVALKRNRQNSISTGTTSGPVSRSSSSTGDTSVSSTRKKAKVTVHPTTLTPRSQRRGNLTSQLNSFHVADTVDGVNEHLRSIAAPMQHSEMIVAAQTRDGLPLQSAAAPDQKPTYHHRNDSSQQGQDHWGYPQPAQEPLPANEMLQYSQPLVHRQSANQQTTGMNGTGPGPWVNSVPPLVTSFSSTSSVNEPYQSDRTPTTFPGRMDYNFSPYAQGHNGLPMPPQQVYQVHQGTQFPQPQIETVPNTPLFSPMDMTHMQQSTDALAQTNFPAVYSLPYSMPPPQTYAMPAIMPDVIGPSRPELHEPERYDLGPHIAHDHQQWEENYNQQHFPTHMSQISGCLQSLPAHVVRGFTGHGSGCGDGAWT